MVLKVTNITAPERPKRCSKICERKTVEKVICIRLNKRTYKQRETRKLQLQTAADIMKKNQHFSPHFLYLQSMLKACQNFIFTEIYQSATCNGLYFPLGFYLSPQK